MKLRLNFLGVYQSELNAKWSEEKLMLEQQKNLAEKKYHEINEQVAAAL